MHIVKRLCRFQTSNDTSRHRGRRIPLRGIDDGQRRIVRPYEIIRLQPSLHGSDEGGKQVGLKARHQNFTFGVPETRIIFDQFRPVRRDHEARKQNPFERRAAPFHLVHGRQDHLLHHTIPDRVGHNRRR